MATAHHVSNIIANRNEASQRQVWVPFHFLPGNQGEEFSERLMCREDSRIARDMVAHHLGYADQSVGIYLMGVAAHVYADTFSHFGSDLVTKAGMKKWLASAFLAAVRTGGREEFGQSFSWGVAGKTPSASKRTK